jgi:hypothetical protein
MLCRAISAVSKLVEMRCDKLMAGDGGVEVIGKLMLQIEIAGCYIADIASEAS